MQPRTPTGDFQIAPLLEPEAGEAGQGAPGIAAIAPSEHSREAKAQGRPALRQAQDERPTSPETEPGKERGQVYARVPEENTEQRKGQDAEGSLSSEGIDGQRQQ